MITPNDYAIKGCKVFPVQFNAKEPRKGYSHTKDGAAAPDQFQPTENIGWILDGFIDLDIDNYFCNKFLSKYVAEPAATFGRENKPVGHYIFKGDLEEDQKKSFILPKEFNPYVQKDWSHEYTLIEIRNGSGKYVVAPGSIVGNEKIVWQRNDMPSPYPGKIYNDVAKVALSAALTLAYPGGGSRDHYCTSIAGILATYTKWDDSSIDDFVGDIAEASGKENSIKDLRERQRKGTAARKAMEKDNHVFGFTKLSEILKLTDLDPLFSIFEWIGIKRPNKHLAKFKKRIVYLEDSCSMYDIETKRELKKEEFNNRHLLYFPGGKNTPKAFESLMKDPEFERQNIVLGRVCIPGAGYPIAEIKNHPHLETGRYLNLYNRPPYEPVKGDVTPWTKAFKILYGNHYDLFEQWAAAVMQKTFARFITDDEKKLEEIGPGKIQFGPLVVGPEGTGKKALGYTIQRLIGREFVDPNATFDEMMSNHSEVILNKLFICINEVVTTGSIDNKTEISNKLKPFWTDEQTKINPKHIRPYYYFNNANGICFSNEEDCLYLGKSSRRYIVMHQNFSVKQLEQFEADGLFKNLYDFILSDKMKYLFYHLLYTVKIKDWSIWNGGRAPKTDDLKTMQDSSQHPVIRRLDRALEDGTVPFDSSFVGFICLESLLDWIKDKWKTQVNEKWVIAWLKENGLKWNNGKQTRQCFHPELGRPRVWLLKDWNHLRELTESTLGHYYKGNYDKHWYKINGFNFDKITGSVIGGEKYETNVERIKTLLDFYLGKGANNHETIHLISDLLVCYLKEDKDLKKLINKSMEEDPNAGSYKDKKILNNEKLTAALAQIKSKGAKDAAAIIEKIKNPVHKREKYAKSLGLKVKPSEALYEE